MGISLDNGMKWRGCILPRGFTSVCYTLVSLTPNLTDDVPIRTAIREFFFYSNFLHVTILNLAMYNFTAIHISGKLAGIWIRKKNKPSK